MLNNSIKTHTIDASDKVLGRLATDIANLLRGKQKTSFIYHQVVGDKVIVKNAKNIKFTGQKLKQKKYYHHTGYPGGIKEKTLEEMFNVSPAEVLKRAIYGMLPKNKLRKRWMKNLQVFDGEEKNAKK